MTDVTWQGVMPALMTEMYDDGSIDFESTSKHIEACLEGGCEGIVVLGTCGENSSLTTEEKVEVIKNAVATVNGRVPILAGVGENTTPRAIEFSSKAKEAGANGLMVMPAMIYEQDSREALAHFSAIAESTDLPIMIYNNPISYNVDLSPEEFQVLSKHENIVAVKESSHESPRITDMINLLGDRYRIFCGVDNLALENTLLGAVGWVSGMANPFPKECATLFALAKEGKVDEAVALYRWFMPLLHLDVNVKLVQYIKLANSMTGMGSENMRSPRLPIAGAEREEIQKVIQAGLASRP